MSAIQRAYRPLFVQAYRANSWGVIWMTVALLCLGVIVLLGLGLTTGNWRVGANMLVGLLGGVAFMWWGALMRGAVLQNSPANACLTPRLRSRLMTMSVVISICILPLLAALTAIVFDHFLYWLVGYALLFPYMLAATRYPSLSILPSMVICVCVGFLRQPLKDAFALATAYGDLPFAVAALLFTCALGAWTLMKAFPAGGDQHIAWRIAAAARSAAQKGRGQVGYAHTAKPLFRPFRISYGAVLRRDSLGTAAPMQMLMHGLGPSVHTANIMLVTCMPPLILAGVIMAGGAGWMHETFFTMMCAGLQVSLLLMPNMYWSRTLMAISNTPVEQGLLRLTPGTPQAQVFNRSLARVLMSRYLQVWAVSSASFFCTGWLTTSSLELSGALLVPIAGTLLMSAVLFRDYAAMRGYNENLNSGMTFVVYFAFFMLASPTHHATDFPWGVVAAIIGGAAVITIGLRWRRMLTLPPAFPAGRMATGAVK